MTSYGYNGLGDRLTETVNGVTTTFTMDLSPSTGLRAGSGLTQALSDGTNDYLYGHGRIAQSPITQSPNHQMEYFLGDALGSVRQLTNSTGALTLAKAYDPYGNVVMSNRSSATTYGFTSEYQSGDSVYLRARHYAPYLNRFLQRDTIVPNPRIPADWNRWAYVRNNPINYTDPSGHYVYDRTSAANYAMAWDHQSGLDPNYDFTSKDPTGDYSNQCTMFASSVLYHGGVRDWRDDPNPKKVQGGGFLEPAYWDINILMAGSWQWLGYVDTNYKGSWYNTNAFYNFATQVIGRTVLTYNNPPQYIDPQKLYGQNAPIDRNWENLMRASRATIQQGDLVFYGDGNNWDHVAVVVGWGLPTTFGLKSDTSSSSSGSEPDLEMLRWIQSLQCRADHWMLYFPPMPLRPLVVERSGGIGYTSWRSLDNTSSPVSVIEIVHIENH